MRLSFIEALCLVAIGATMVELHDTRRFARPGPLDATALATAAKPAAGAAEVRSTETANAIPNAGYR
jgi:hypothetical protein